MKECFVVAFYACQHLITPDHWGDGHVYYANFGSVPKFRFSATTDILDERQFPLLKHDICHKHHKQCLCNIIIAQVKFHFKSYLGFVHVNDKV